MPLVSRVVSARFVLVIATAFLDVVLLEGCGSNNATKAGVVTATPASEAKSNVPASTPITPTNTPSPTSQTFTRSNWAVLQTNPDRYKGAHVDIVGKVFTSPEQDAKGTYWQMWSEPQNDDWNTVVALPNPSFSVSSDDYVHVVGIVKGSFSGTNAFGAKVTGVAVIAQSARVVNALAAAPPAQHVVSVHSSKTQNGVTITLKKVEYAGTETRVFVAVANSSRSTAHFYGFDAKAVQGKQQFSAKSVTDYPEVQSDILSGVTSSGVVVFPAMPYTATRLVFGVSSDNYNLNFAPYQFEVGPGTSAAASEAEPFQSVINAALIKSNKAWRGSLRCACDDGLEGAKAGPDLTRNLANIATLRMKGQRWHIQPISFVLDWVKRDSPTSAEAQVTKNETSRIYSGTSLIQTCSGPYSIHYRLSKFGGAWKVVGASVLGRGQSCS